MTLINKINSSRFQTKPIDSNGSEHAVLLVCFSCGTRRGEMGGVEEKLRAETGGGGGGGEKREKRRVIERKR